MVFFVGLLHHPDGIDDPRFSITETEPRSYSDGSQSIYISGAIKFHTLEEFAAFVEKHQLIYEAPDSLYDYH